MGGCVSRVICLFFSSRRRHTRCAVVTGVQTCARPICCPPRPEMLLNAILELHKKIQQMPLGVNREQVRAAAEAAALASTPTIDLKRSEERRVGKECVSKCRSRR